MNNDPYGYGITLEEMKSLVSLKQIRSGRICEYRMTKKDRMTEWPSDRACLKYCDDNTLEGPPRHLGGDVKTIDLDNKIIIVYTD